MNKLICIIILLSGFVFGASVQAKDCTDAIAKANAYRGIIATVTQVTSKKVSGQEAILYSDGLRYDFTYRYPNGYEGKTYTVLPPDGKYKVANGDKMIWIPASKGIRELYPNEDRHNPAIVDKDCRVFGIDFSTPAKQIAGL